MSGQPDKSGRKNLEEANRRGERRRGRVKTDLDARLEPRSKTSKHRRSRVAAGQPVSVAATKCTEVATGDEPARPRGGTKPLYGNPGSGCGMKQAREAEGGASRREVEKT